MTGLARDLDQIPTGRLQAADHADRQPARLQLGALLDVRLDIGPDLEPEPPAGQDRGRRQGLGEGAAEAEALAVGQVETARRAGGSR